MAAMEVDSPTKIPRNQATYRPLDEPFRARPTVVSSSVISTSRALMRTLLRSLLPTWKPHVTAESGFYRSGPGIRAHQRAGYDVNGDRCRFAFGSNDPANYALPQKSLNRCLFPSSAAYNTFRSCPNPHSFERDGVKFLGTSGQNIHDLEKYSEAKEDKLEFMEERTIKVEAFGAYSTKYSRDPFLTDGDAIEMPI